MKISKHGIFGFILGAIIFGSICVCATTVLSSSSVSYSNTTSGITSTNVQGALDELYNKANNSVSPKVVTKVVNAVYNAEKVVKTYPEANAVNNSTKQVIIPIRYSDSEDDNSIYILNSVVTTLYAEWKQWMYIGGGNRCLYAAGYADTKVIALDENQNEISTIFSDSQSCFQSNQTKASTCNLFERSIPDGTEYLKIINYGKMGFDEDGYDTLSSSGSATNTTATYLKLNLN